MPTHLSLFSGIGGLDLAAEAAGFRTVGQCEYADYPTRVLERYWPDVPRWRDIRTLTGDDFYARTGLRTVDVVSGGFPCQPFSTAGKRRGADDDRYLWPDMLRVVADLRPAWVVGENVAGIVSMALDTVLADLEAQGYEAGAYILPACGVDAPHRRYRVAIVAHTYSIGSASGIADSARREKRYAEEFIDNGADVADTYGFGLCGQRTGKCNNHRKCDGKAQKQVRWAELHEIVPSCEAVPDTKSADVEGWMPIAGEEKRLAAGGWWSIEPDVGRVAHGIPARVDRLKCLGNAVVPAQFYPVFDAIYKIIQSEKKMAKHENS